MRVGASHAQESRQTDRQADAVTQTQRSRRHRRSQLLSSWLLRGEALEMSGPSTALPSRFKTFHE